MFSDIFQRIIKTIIEKEKKNFFDKTFLYRLQRDYKVLIHPYL